MSLLKKLSTAHKRTIPLHLRISEAEAMFNYTDFHDVFPTGVHHPYDRKLQHDIEAHRKNVDGLLFIDRVLRALGISKGN